MKKQTTIERLDMIATMLEELPKWRKEMVIPKELKNAIKKLPTKFKIAEWSCGTSACAIGFAMWHPWFQSRGLKPHVSTWISESVLPFYYSGNKRFAGEGFNAAAEFFGISPEIAMDLFSYDRDSIRRQEVAERIRKYVREVLL